jgi:hypothetical protein
MREGSAVHWQTAKHTPRNLHSPTDRQNSRVQLTAMISLASILNPAPPPRLMVASPGHPTPVQSPPLPPPAAIDITAVVATPTAITSSFSSSSSAVRLSSSLHSAPFSHDERSLPGGQRCQSPSPYGQQSPPPCYEDRQHDAGAEGDHRQIQAPQLHSHQPQQLHSRSPSDHGYHPEIPPGHPIQSPISPPPPPPPMSMPTSRSMSRGPALVKSKANGLIKFPPYEDLDAAARLEVRRFCVSPIGDIQEYSRHIPYNSGKKNFYDRTGRESFEGKLFFSLHVLVLFLSFSHSLIHFLFLFRILRTFLHFLVILSLFSILFTFFHSLVFFFFFCLFYFCVLTPSSFFFFFSILVTFSLSRISFLLFSYISSPL